LKVPGRADSQTSGLNFDLIMYGLTPHPVDYNIVTNSVMPIAHMTDKSLLIQSLAKSLSLVTKKKWDARGWETLV
jgi:hypothetical protein